MTAIKHILCPVDFSEFSRHALEIAAAIARQHDASVTALHVVPPAPSAYPALGVGAYVPYVYSAEDLQEFQKTLEQYVAAVDYPIAAVSVTAVVVSEILSRAAALPADLIVMGTHGRTGLDRLVLGSVAERVLVRAPCPVLTVPQRAADVAPTEKLVFRNILCPIDFSPSSMLALEYAEALAHEGAKLRVLHVAERLPAWQLVPSTTGAADDPFIVIEQARERVRDVIPEGLRQMARVEALVTEGDAGDEILRAAAAHGVDLIVMGAHAGGAGLFGFGSTTHDVLRTATCPVLTLKA